MPLGLSSRVIVILMSFQPITGYYEKTLNKEFLRENFSNNSPHDPYYILKVSAQTDEFFLIYRISQKWTIFEAFVRK